MKRLLWSLTCVVALGSLGCASSSGSGGGLTTGGDTTGASSGTSSGGSSGGSTSTGDDSSVSSTQGTGSGSSGAGASSSGGGTQSTSSGGGGATGTDATVASDAGSSVEDFVPTTADFDCLQDSDWTTIGVSRFKNVLGHTAEMLAVARSADGGVYPVGTIVQLIPTEASAKRGAGYSVQSDNWEFFSLSVSASGSTIVAAGGDAGVSNAFGSCLGCHSQAAPQWDFVCGDPDGGNVRGCPSLPLTGSQLAIAQSTDPRCP